ncbi:c-type cytochrome [Parahaliea mediterranea]|uniref:c-type cytochrome n=1 Tax=Parahaliea mediterranea TaxID=651086 RepID=UPI000E2E96DC|nr:cytochrome c [Parahaliea mediterranea]
MKNRVYRVLAATVLTVASGTAIAEAPGPAQSCVACHGQQGQSASAQWPNLAGQHAAYLADQITAFRDGTRENEAMMPFVKELSDEDIQQLADYYAKLPLTTSASGDPALVERGQGLAGYCSACHGMRGEPVAQNWPILAGQHAAYLEQQLKAYKSSKRVHPLMQAALSRLGNDDFKALAAYYSQLVPE